MSTRKVWVVLSGRKEPQNEKQETDMQGADMRAHISQAQLVTQELNKLVAPEVKVKEKRFEEREISEASVTN